MLCENNFDDDRTVKQALRLALTHGDWDVMLPAGVQTDNIDIEKATEHITHVEQRDDCLLIESEMTITTSRKVSRATRRHPAEYKRRDIDIRVVASYYPDDHNKCEVEIYVI
jgi:hypothetical protein